MEDSKKLVKSIVGNEGYETLEKAITKMNTRSIVDIEELHASLKIVPKSIMSFLMVYAKVMQPGHNKTVTLPWADNCTMLLNKRDQDVYSGHIIKNGRIEHEFDLVSIPQLAAHIMSYFEMYETEDEETPAKEESKESSNLEKKINTLLVLLASSVIGNKIMADKDEGSSAEESSAEESSSEESSEESSSEEIEKSEKDSQKKNTSAFVKALKKAVGGPKMPSPPQAGTKVGGMQGIAQTGFHGDKTASTDKPGHPISTAIKDPKVKSNPQAKAMFKLPKAPKLMQSEENESKKINQIIIKKSEYSSQCNDCGSKLAACKCFTALSKPTVIDMGNDVKLKFNDDWTDDAILSLTRSIKSKKD
jgi:hypothetical protein